jgi:hypothetical protein
MERERQRGRGYADGADGSDGGGRECEVPGARGGKCNDGTCQMVVAFEIAAEGAL